MKRLCVCLFVVFALTVLCVASVAAENGYDVDKDLFVNDLLGVIDDETRNQMETSARELSEMYPDFIVKTLTLGAIGETDEEKEKNIDALFEKCIGPKEESTGVLIVYVEELGHELVQIGGQLTDYIGVFKLYEDARLGRDEIIAGEVEEGLFMKQQSFIGTFKEQAATGYSYTEQEAIKEAEKEKAKLREKRLLALKRILKRVWANWVFFYKVLLVGIWVATCIFMLIVICCFIWKKVD